MRASNPSPPISSAATVSVPSNDFGGTKEQQGAALPVQKARLSVGSFDKTVQVTDDMTEAVFQVPLEKGACKIQAEFLGNEAKKFPVYYLNVERMKP